MITSLCAPIADILQNVESLTIENTSINADLNGRLFTLMPSLKKFTVLIFPDRPINDILSRYSNTAWLQQPCPTLEHFVWHVGLSHRQSISQFPSTEIKRFLTLNSGIKFISLRLDSKEQLKVLMASDIPVNELFFAVNECSSTTIAEIMEDLKIICGSRKSAKKVEETRLHLQINGIFEENSDRLELLAPYLVGLYFECMVPKCFAPIFPKLFKLKVLQAIEYIPNIELLRVLPNLEEIYIPCLRRPLSYFEAGNRTLATGLPKLKTLFLNHYLFRSLNNLLSFGSDSFDDENFEVFAEIDDERKKLPGAKRLKVYLEVEHGLNEVKTDFDTIAIERSQSEAITNPFIQVTQLANCIAAPDGCVIQ